MTDTVKIKAPADDRKDVEKNRAQRVDLPAGSYNLSSVKKALNEAALAKHDKDRGDRQQKAVAELNQTPTPGDEVSVPFHKRLVVEDEKAGITEARLVYDAKAAKKEIVAAEKAEEDNRAEVVEAVTEAATPKGE